MKEKHIVLLLTLVCVLGLAGCGSSQAYRIKITIPAGSTEAVVYSDEEISPKGNKITISSGEGSENTEIVLKPIEAKEENAYDQPVYLAPGSPIEMDAEKGAWFQIGVSMQNESNMDKVVYVEVKGVDVRIY